MNPSQPRKFELLISENQNWFSRYGGILTLAIMLIMMVGLVKVKIPQFEEILVNLDKEEIELRMKNNPQLLLENKNSLQLFLDNGSQIELVPTEIKNLGQGGYAIAMNPEALTPMDRNHLDLHHPLTAKLYSHHSSLLDCLIQIVQ